MKKILMVLTVASLMACAGNEKKSSDKKTAEKVTETLEEVEVEKEVVEITVNATGESMAEMVFEPASISIPANSRVKLTFNNQSSAAGMLHNFVLVELGTGQEIATAGIAAGKEKEFVPNNAKVLAYTTVVDLGKSTVLEFDAPKKGSYHYICTYPGHYPKMIGRMNVE